jgi:hypothetical protein
MVVPTFVDLQGFTIKHRRFIVKEVAVLRKGTVLTHYIFANPMPWYLLTKSDKSCASCLTANHHGLRWEDGMVPYNMAKHLITTAVFDTEEDDFEAIVYVKGCQKREWLTDMLEDARDAAIIETLDADYEDIESLNNLDVTNTMRCGKHVKNCALQNVFKIFNWWSQRQKDL